jgi:hypothetical protein
MGNNFNFPLDEEYQNASGGSSALRSGKPPPASSKAIHNLPIVHVTADDLIEETNKECLICLEDQKIGSSSCKLPCGHLFHKPCLTDWLQKQCTCPVCRYELETDDREFESSRKARMNQRKLRMRKDELSSKSISQLKELAKKLSVNTSDCLDKREIVEKIIASGKVTITEGIPPIEMTEDEFLGKNVGELKHLLLSFGLSTEGALEKSELRQRLVDSGRIQINVSYSSNDNSFDAKLSAAEAEASNALPGSSMVAESVTRNVPITIEKEPINSQQQSSTANNNPIDPLIYTKDELKAMSLSALREVCRRNQLDTSGCLDKSEVVELIFSSQKQNNNTQMSSSGSSGNSNNIATSSSAARRNSDSGGDNHGSNYVLQEGEQLQEVEMEADGQPVIYSDFNGKLTSIAHLQSVSAHLPCLYRYRRLLQRDRILSFLK